MDDKKLKELAARYTMEAIRLGLPLTEVITKEQVAAITERQIAMHTNRDEPQRDYVQALETLMNFPDEGMMHGQWNIISAAQEQPFVIGDAPVVTMERDGSNRLSFGIGFARPNVEVFLPVSPTACLHILPRVDRTLDVRRPSPVEVNMAQAAFATKYCYGNINSPAIDATLRPEFGKVILGKTGFNTRHVDLGEVVFDILMGRQPQATSAL